MSAATRETTLELGEILFEARVGRGLTLEEAERDTRISRRYLEALEREDLSCFPAPFYARAFLRTYAQYLGLDANQVVNILPQNRPQQELAPLPELERPRLRAFSMSWVVAAGAIVFLLVVGLILYNTGGNGGDSLSDGGTEALVEPNQALAGEQPAPPPAAAGAPIAPVEDGFVADFQGALQQDAVDMLNRQGYEYVIIEVANPDVAPGLVFQQAPAAGAELDDDEHVTLYVSRVQ